jgi:hypothetical protein
MQSKFDESRVHFKWPVSDTCTCYAVRLSRERVQKVTNDATFVVVKNELRHSLKDDRELRTILIPRFILHRFVYRTAPRSLHARFQDPTPSSGRQGFARPWEYSGIYILVVNLNSGRFERPYFYHLAVSAHKSQIFVL